MSVPALQSADESDATNSVEESGRGWIFSLAFWLCLVFSALLYAAIALSPKLLAYFTLKQEYQTHQLKLVGLERQIEQTQKVIEALQHDPSFARELARVDFDAVKGDEERIPVDAGLSKKVRPGAPDLTVPPPDLPWYTPILRVLAYSRIVGNTMLAISAGMIIYAFTFLGERSWRRIN